MRLTKLLEAEVAEQEKRIDVLLRENHDLRLASAQWKDFAFKFASVIDLRRETNVPALKLNMLVSELMLVEARKPEDVAYEMGRRVVNELLGYIKKRKAG